MHITAILLHMCRNVKFITLTCFLVEADCTHRGNITFIKLKLYRRLIDLINSVDIHYLSANLR